MTVYTDTSTTSGTTGTTVGTRVRDDGTGGIPRYLDIYLHIESSKVRQAAPPSPGPAGSTLQVDSERLSAWWKNVLLPAGGTINLSYRIRPRAGTAYEGAVEGLLVVVDRGPSALFLVRRFCICPRGMRILLPELGDKGRVSTMLRKPTKLEKTSAGRKRKAVSRKAPARKKAAKRRTARAR